MDISWLEQECGVDINYRCVRCRDCSTCKDADRTEAISLREEAEMELIDQSVKLDLENKQILCSLPLRGEEKHFLSSNYNQAFKILEHQVKQYSGQEETKQLIIKAFNKLFDNGHAALMEQLTAEEKALFVEKEVQYYIPWRIAFSDSVSTPARPVIDASSRTRTRPDGTGGKSLNNLVCQGKVETLNLLKLVLNFRVGKFALTGDLEQFYNSCKLVPRQWNLQRFIWQQDLNPDAPIEEGVITTLMYGVKSVAAQSGYALEQLAETVKESDPELYDFLMLCLYVDDLGNSQPTLDSCLQLAQRTE